MRAGTIAGITLAVVAGIAAGEAIVRSEICRDLIGRCCGRGHLTALVHGRGIYQDDVNREIAAVRYLSGQEQQSVSNDVVIKRLIANENFRQTSARDVLPEVDLQREFDYLRHQFADDNSWRKRLSDTGESEHRLRSSLAENIRGRDSIERSIADRPVIDEPALHKYYEEHQLMFAQPPRFRASHIFLFAPPGTSPEIVEAKQKLINSLAERLGAGEEFDALVSEASEDEATKPRGGDLSYFSDSRIPPDFFEIVSQMKVGQPAKVIRTTLGFHLLRLTETKPGRQMSFAEVRREILLRLRNSARREMVNDIEKQWAGSSALRARSFWN
jgi:parvulin-like peptidyl-prolyl isomerase